MAKKVSKIPKGQIKPFLVSQKEKLETQRKEKEELASKKLNRIERMQREISQATDSPDKLMQIIQSIFDDIETYPRPGNIYTFVYTPKTPEILYDQHPLSIIDSITLSGFRGYNVHWSEFRNYVWEGVGSSFHKIKKGDEFNYLRDIPYKKILSTRFG